MSAKKLKSDGHKDVVPSDLLDSLKNLFSTSPEWSFKTSDLTAFAFSNNDHTVATFAFTDGKREMHQGVAWTWMGKWVFSPVLIDDTLLEGACLAVLADDDDGILLEGMQEEGAVEADLEDPPTDFPTVFAGLKALGILPDHVLFPFECCEVFNVNPDPTKNIIVAFSNTNFSDHGIWASSDLDEDGVGWSAGMFN